MQLEFRIGLGTTIQGIDEVAGFAQRQRQGQDDLLADPRNHGIYAGIGVVDELGISCIHCRHPYRLLIKQAKPDLVLYKVSDAHGDTLEHIRP